MESADSLHNPILDSYLNFKEKTPFVTRYVLLSQLVCFFLSFICEPSLSFGLANIPHFTINQYEIYRIFLSPFICNRFLSLIFAYFSFIDTGQRLEKSMGSTSFLLLILSIGFLVNILFVGLTFLASFLTGNEAWLMSPASGIWIILFAIIKIECSQASQQSERRIFLFPVRTPYYPLALFGVFLLFGLLEWCHFISITLGYAYVNGYLNYIKPGPGRCRKLEETVLESLARREGWIACSSVLGSGAWSETNEKTDTSSFLSHFRNQYQDGSNNTSMSSSGEEKLSFPTSGGQRLGGASRRSASTLDPREARLQAIERRLDATSTDEIV